MHAKKLRGEIKHLRDDLENKRGELERLVNTCKHDWGETTYVPLYRKAYTVQGDYDGQGKPTLGVDSRPDCHVPSKTVPRWTRKCKLCSHTEETYNKKSVGVSGGLSKEAPDFGNRGSRPWDMACGL